MKKMVASMVLLSLVGGMAGCATPQQTQGTGVGAAVGGIAGALLDRKNPWRGGMIGAALGGVAGASLSEVSDKGSREAAKTWKPVEYRTDDGRDVYRAEPVAVDQVTKCKKVRERVWQDGSLVKDEVREVCRGESTERGY